MKKRLTLLFAVLSILLASGFAAHGLPLTSHHQAAQFHTDTSYPTQPYED